MEDGPKCIFVVAQAVRNRVVPTSRGICSRDHQVREGERPHTMCKLSITAVAIINSTTRSPQLFSIDRVILFMKTRYENTGVLRPLVTRAINNRHLSRAIARRKGKRLLVSASCALANQTLRLAILAVQKPC